MAQRWSTSLPRRGSRVRSPSRAFFIASNWCTSLGLFSLTKKLVAYKINKNGPFTVGIFMNQRETNYDYLRSLSCIAIVLAHVASSYWGVVDRGGSQFVIMSVYNAITRFAVPVFMMLSGAFLLEPAKGSNIKKCIKRFGKFALNFYIWSAFYAFQGIAVKFVTGKEITKDLLFSSGQRFLWGHYHMWFVFLVLGFYLLLPIISKFTEHKTVMEHFLMLWVGTRFLIPTLTALVPKLNAMNTWISKLDLNMLVGYLGYFVLGFYIRKHGFQKKARIALYIAGGVSALHAIVETIRESRLQDRYVEDYFSSGSFGILVFSVAVFTFFAYFKQKDTCPKLIASTAKYSFIIYMVHPFFLEKLNLLGVTTISFNTLLSIPVLTIGIFIASYLVAAFIKKIPYINKILV